MLVCRYPQKANSELGRLTNNRAAVADSSSRLGCGVFTGSGTRGSPTPRAQSPKSRVTGTPVPCNGTMGDGVARTIGCAAGWNRWTTGSGRPPTWGGRHFGERYNRARACSSGRYFQVLHAPDRSPHTSTRVEAQITHAPGT